MKAHSVKAPDGYPFSGPEIVESKIRELNAKREMHETESINRFLDVTPRRLWGRVLIVRSGETDFRFEDDGSAVVAESAFDVVLGERPCTLAGWRREIVQLVRVLRAKR